MLVLRRLLHEKIVIGGNIVIEVTEIGRGHVKIGVDAPKRVSVDREEIHIAKLSNRRPPIAEAATDVES